MLPATIAILFAMTTLAAAQDQTTPKVELFGGYSFVHPGANIHGQLPGASLPVSSRLEVNPRGAGLSATYNFNRWFGLTLDGSTHWGSGESTLARRIDDAAFSNLSFGPKVTFRGNHFSPFLEALIGDHRLMPDAFHDVDKLGFLLGGGLDVKVSKHVALRLLRADYVMSSYRYGPKATTASTDLRGVRLQSGIVFLFGGKNSPVMTPSAACSIEPAEVNAGEPVTATAAGSDFKANRTLKYEWSGTGVKPSSNDATAHIDTTGLQPGPYRVTANLSDGSRGGVAACSASFTVKQPQGPTISCSSDPATVQPGAPSTIHSTASSADSRPLTYSYSATAGSISGTDASATLQTGNAPAGPITVTCNVADDRTPPLTASSTTTVNVEAPPEVIAPPPPVEASQLNKIDFKQNSPRVDNTAKAILDDVALRLQRDAGSKVVLVGEADSSEKNGARLAAQRALNTKAYLVNEKGVDSARIETRSGSASGEQVQIWLVPVGSSFDTNGTSSVTAAPRPAATRRKPATTPKM